MKATDASSDGDIALQPLGAGEAWDYDAFISYRIKSSSWCARRVERGLQAITKRYGDGGIRVFRDETALRAGPLDDSLLNKLGKSRCLIVVLDSMTVHSTYVSDEIRHWLDTGGSPDRLFLVRSDPALNMDWNTKHECFEHPSGLPGPLHAVFDSVQYRIDLPRWRALGTESKLIQLWASILDVSPDISSIVEARQRRRLRRILIGVIAGLSLGLMAMTVLAVAAIRSRERAERQTDRAERSEAEAVSHADATEAILAARDTPTLGIERAITASLHSDSPTVRSAMLAVSEEARRLRRTITYPEEVTGHPPSRALFQDDTFLAWGPTDNDRSFVQAWDLANGETRFAGQVDVTDLSDIVWLEPETLVGCSAAGPVAATFTEDGAEVTVLDEAQSAPQNNGCVAREFAGGALAMSVPTSTDAGVAYYLDPQGDTTRIEGVSSVISDQVARTGLVSGPAGVAVVGPEGFQQLTSEPAMEATFADRRGHFLVRLAGTTWAVVTPGEEGPTLRTIEVPDSAVDVAPMLNFGHFTGELAWITSDGTIGWTGSDATTQVQRNWSDSPDRPGYQTTLEPMQNEQFAVVVGRTMVVVDGPGSFSEEPPVGDRTTWAQTPNDRLLPQPTQPGIDPVRATCGDRSRVLLGEWPSDRGSYLIDSHLQGRGVADRSVLTYEECRIVEIAESLSAGDGLGEQFEIRSPVVYNGVTVDPSGTQVAILRDGQPIEILWTLPTAQLPAVWEMRGIGGLGTTPAAMGERQLSTHFEEAYPPDDGLLVAELRIQGPDGTVETFPLPDRGRWVAVRPDGQGGVWETSAPEGERDRVIVGDPDDDAVDGTCGEGSNIQYVPGRDFRTSGPDAEAQTPVTEADEGLIDCRTGEPVDLDHSITILEYEVGADRGRIVSDNGDNALVVTTWHPGDTTSLRSMTWHDAPEISAIMSFDESESTMVLADSEDTRDLTIYGRDGQSWHRLVRIESLLQEVADATLVDDGSLLLVVSTDGAAFELYDTESGRRLIAGTNPRGGSQLHVTRVAAQAVDGRVYATLIADDEFTGRISLEIPIDIPTLTRLLCNVHSAPDCPSPDSSRG